MSIKDFEVIKSLGSGSFASVYKVKRISDSKEYAMKKVKMNQLKQKERENAVNEVRILASINDPNIIRYKEAFYDDDSGCLCIIMEYADGGDLLNKISEFKRKGELIDEDIAWKYFTQMLSGLKALHNMKILHRDLKCANIFLTSDHVIKLGDLNVSKIAKAGFVYTQTGTPYYASPEVWKDQPYDGKSDIWSLGCVLYELLCLKPPFRAFGLDGLYKKVIKGVYDPIPQRYSSELSNIIAMCLQVNPANRPTCEQLLSNPIIQKRMGNFEISPPKPKYNGNIKYGFGLLNTIKMPRNLRALQENLPKPNYNIEVNKSFDACGESKELIPFGNVNHSVDYYPKGIFRAITSDQQRRPLDPSANKENRSNPLSRGGSIDDIKKPIVNQSNSNDPKSIAPLKKPGLPLAPSPRLKARDEGNFQRIASNILNGGGVDIHNTPQSYHKQNTPTSENPITPVIIHKNNIYGYPSTNEKKSIFTDDKRANLVNKLISKNIINNIGGPLLNPAKPNSNLVLFRQMKRLWYMNRSKSLSDQDLICLSKSELKDLLNSEFFFLIKFEKNICACISQCEYHQ